MNISSKKSAQQESCRVSPIDENSRQIGPIDTNLTATPPNPLTTVAPQTVGQTMAAQQAYAEGSYFLFEFNYQGSIL